MTAPPGYRWAWRRDVPRSCSCGWEWRTGRYVRVTADPDCPWHIQATTRTGGTT